MNTLKQFGEWHDICRNNNMTKHSSLLALVMCALPVAAFAQPVAVGVIGGVPITDAFETAQGNNRAYITNTHRYVVGGVVAFHLPARFSLEVDGLYRRLGYDFHNINTPFNYTATTANSWEFPVLAKWEIVPGPIRPFIGAGGTIRHITGIHQVRQVVSGATFNNVEVTNPPDFNKDTDIGFTFGGGIAFKAGPVRIAPELRYTRWGGENFRDPINALLRTNRNQGDFLIAFTF